MKQQLWKKIIQAEKDGHDAAKEDIEIGKMKTIDVMCAINEWISRLDFQKDESIISLVYDFAYISNWIEHLED